MNDKNVRDYWVDVEQNPFNHKPNRVMGWILNIVLVAIMLGCFWIAVG